MEEKKSNNWGVWVAQLVKHPTLAQVMISRFMSSSPVSGSVLRVRTLGFSLSAPPFILRERERERERERVSTKSDVGLELMKL